MQHVLMTECTNSFRFPGTVNDERIASLILMFNFFIMSMLVKEFNDYCTKMNEVILSKDNLVIKRLWNLDTNTW